MDQSNYVGNTELMALHRGERDYYYRDEDYAREHYDLVSECRKDERGGRDISSAMYLEIYDTQREKHMYSNLGYNGRLEELKNTHLWNVAELERMHISQCSGDDDGGLGRGRNKEARKSKSSGPVSNLQRINSEEELDFHETSSGSDQSELYSEDVAETLGGPNATSPHGQTSRRHMLLYRTHGEFRVQSSSKVTVPKPFMMMLREEERKKRKVRTRSEMELENVLLRRELDELRECQKKFKASPAPAHIHLPLYEVISHRTSLQTNQWKRITYDHKCDSKTNRTSGTTSPRPFRFLERERRKREVRIVEELGILYGRKERVVFKARPMPRSVYGTRHKTGPETKKSPPMSPATHESEVTEA